MQQERNKVVQECKKSYIHKIDTGAFPEGTTDESLRAKIKAEEEKILKYQDDLSKGIKTSDKESKFTGTAFITFQYEAHKNTILKEFKMKGWDKFKMSFIGAGNSTGPCSFRGYSLFYSFKIF